MSRLRPSRSVLDVSSEGRLSRPPSQLPEPDADKRQSRHQEHVELIRERDQICGRDPGRAEHEKQVLVQYRSQTRGHYDPQPKQAAAEFMHRIL